MGAISRMVPGFHAHVFGAVRGAYDCMAVSPVDGSILPADRFDCGAAHDHIGLRDCLLPRYSHVYDAVTAVRHAGLVLLANCSHTASVPPVLGRILLDCLGSTLYACILAAGFHTARLIPPVICATVGALASFADCLGTNRAAVFAVFANIVYRHCFGRGKRKGDDCRGVYPGIDLQFCFPALQWSGFVDPAVCRDCDLLLMAHPFQRRLEIRAGVAGGIAADHFAQRACGHHPGKAHAIFPHLVDPHSS